MFSPHFSELVTTLFPLLRKLRVCHRTFHKTYHRVPHCMSTIHLLKFITTMHIPHYLDPITIMSTFHFVVNVIICVHIISWGSSQYLGLITVLSSSVPLEDITVVWIHNFLQPTKLLSVPCYHEPTLCYPDTPCFIEPVRKKKFSILQHHI